MKRDSCQGGEKVVVSQCKGVAVLQVTVKTLIKQVNCDLRGGARFPTGGRVREPGKG